VRQPIRFRAYRRALSFTLSQLQGYATARRQAEDGQDTDSALLPADAPWTSFQLNLNNLNEDMQMNKRKCAWTATIVTLIVAAAGIAWTLFGVHEVSMSQSSIQAKIDEKMPVTQKGVTISGVKLDLTDNKINLSLDASATKFKTEYRMHTTTRGTLRYDHGRGAFYFQPETLKITDLQANGSNVADKVGGFIDKWVDSKKIQDNKAELAAKAEEVAQTLVQKSAETVLKHVAVYKLKGDFKGIVVRAVLTDVEVKDGNVIAHLSLWQLTKTVFAFIFALIIGIAFLIALAANPSWGTPLLVLGTIADLGS